MYVRLISDYVESTEYLSQRLAGNVADESGFDPVSRSHLNQIQGRCMLLRIRTRNQVSDMKRKGETGRHFGLSGRCNIKARQKETATISSIKAGKAAKKEPFAWPVATIPISQSEWDPVPLTPRILRDHRSPRKQPGFPKNRTYPDPEFAVAALRS